MNYENTEGCRIIQAGFQEQTLQVVRTITTENRKSGMYVLAGTYKGRAVFP